MANYGYMTIRGERQGLMSAGCSTQESIGNKCQANHVDQIMVLAFTHNMASGGSTQHALHRPVVITKNVDKSSPLLSQALASGERIDCTIDFYRASSNGIQEKFYTVEIEGGLIRELVQDMPHVMQNSDEQPQEHLAISYREITWTHVTARTYGYASWGAER